jgi:hypothetical protein
VVAWWKIMKILEYSEQISKPCLVQKIELHSEMEVRGNEDLIVAKKNDEKYGEDSELDWNEEIDYYSDVWNIKCRSEEGESLDDVLRET